MQGFYQKHYKAYHEKTFHIDPASFLEPLIVQLKPGARILDVGCGSGRDMCWLKARGFSVSGFERSEGLADLARKHTGCEIIEGDFEVYDFSKLTIDAILLSGSLVHIPHRRFKTVFRNITGCLEEGGNVLLSLKHGERSSTDGDGRTFYLWRDAALRDIFKSLDFDVLNFHRDVSKVNQNDMWLSYILKNTVIY